jgi:hypothetical protein
VAAAVVATLPEAVAVTVVATFAWPVAELPAVMVTVSATVSEVATTPSRRVRRRWCPLR